MDNRTDAERGRRRNLFIKLAWLPLSLLAVQLMAEQPAKRSVTITKYHLHISPMPQLLVKGCRNQARTNFR